MIGVAGAEFGGMAAKRRKECGGCGGVRGAPIGAREVLP